MYPRDSAGRGGNPQIKGLGINVIQCSSMAVSLFVQSVPSGLVTFLPLLLIMVIFYFLLIMPAQRRQKKTAQMLQALKNGDKVITNGGIYGTVVGLEDDTVQLRIADQVKIKLSRNAIVSLQQEPQKES
ncbi:MAG: preprotein translocase subunit YajC [Candidatus Acidiferrales bacterium]